MRLPRIPKLVTGAPADLSERDPDFIRQMLPRLWLVAQTWFRAEVRGFENVPDEPVLFVGNHSGGAMVPDTFVFLLAHNTYFTVEGRPLYALGHEVVTAMPFFGPLARKIGVVTADPQAAGQIFAEGASALVYPGGDVEALRPWRDRHKIVFDGRKGFLKLAHANGVKIVPVVATGGQDTFFVLNDGRKTARALRMDKLLRVKSLPISVSLPGVLGFARFAFVARTDEAEEWDVFLEIGTLHVGGRVEVTRPSATHLSWQSDRGTRHRFDLAVEPVSDDPGAALVRMEIEYALSGLLMARASELLARGIVARHLEAGLEEVRHHLEH